VSRIIAYLLNFIAGLLDNSRGGDAGKFAP
jgi:hypothetical protein